MCRFCHLHLHTQYSFLDGANKIERVIQRAVELEQPAVAMTDHGNMHGALEFYGACKKAGIRPVIGCELYVAPVSRCDREKIGGEYGYHLTVIAQTQEGYRNLCALSTAGFKEGFYYKPRVDRELLEKHNAGLIVLSGCLAGELAQAIKEFQNGDVSDRRVLECAQWYARTFSDRYYIETQPHNIEEQSWHNEFAREIAFDLALPIVATGDVHYTNSSDRKAQELLMCVSTGKTYDDPNRIRHDDGVQLHLMSASEMLDRGMPADELQMAAEIAESCDVNLVPSKYFMPKYSFQIGELNLEVSAEATIECADFHLAGREDLALRLGKELSEEGLFELPAEYKARIDREIELIKKMGFTDYFCVVADFIQWAKRNDIPVGPGRGSAAGSLVAYALGITDIDPIEHGLLFERFLNPDRVSLPDIDVDFCPSGRDRVIDYVRQKYGEDTVAQIATFGTLQARAALKDTCRALGRPYSEASDVASLIPQPRQGFHYHIKDALEMEPRLAAYADGDGKEVVELAMQLEGLTRHVSTHAAGVVIGDRPLVEHLPLMVDKDGKLATQFSMQGVEKIGLVKFDFLGLKTLTVIDRAAKLAGVDISRIPTDFAPAYEMLTRGETVGIFQLESGGITEVVKRLKPNCFADLVAILALYRPGPLESGMVERYIERKNGREEVEVLHPLMSEPLRETYGIMLYQEQIMQLARDLAGYTLAEADILRKAMGKKNPEEMAKQRVRFVDGCACKDISAELAGKIFDQMETFARYGFNKSHSVAYALISYQTAYLKALHPAEFMAALMSSELDTVKVQKNIAHCRALGISLAGPDINFSGIGFTSENRTVRFGLDGVAGCGETLVKSIIDEREHGDFSSFTEFLERMLPYRITSRAVESLIHAGAFDGFGTRKDLCAITELLLDHARKNKTRKNKKPAPAVEMTGEEWSLSERLQRERAALGVYLSGHPVERMRRALTRRGVVTVESLAGRGSVCGAVTKLALKNTKKGERYGSFSIEDETGSIDALIWPRALSQLGEDILENTEPMIFTGTVQLDASDKPTLIVESILKLEVRRTQ